MKSCREKLLLPENNKREAAHNRNFHSPLSILLTSGFYSNVIYETAFNSTHISLKIEKIIVELFSPNPTI